MLGSTTGGWSPGSWLARLALLALMIGCRPPVGDAGDTLSNVADGAVPGPWEWRTLPAVDHRRPVGTAHPTVVIASASRGRWVVACQERLDTDGNPGIFAARRGRDLMSTYLLRGGGDGEAIDELVAVSPDERWLAASRGGKLVVVDDEVGAEATVEWTEARSAPDVLRRTAAFDGRSRYFLRVSQTAGGSLLTIYDLVARRERTVATPGQRVSRLVPEPDGSWVRLVFSRGARDGTEPFDGPPGEPHRGPSCGHGRSRPWMFGLTAVQSWLQPETGEIRSDPEVLGRLGDLPIARSADRGLHVGPNEIVPATCDAEVHAVSAQPLRIVATCASATQDAPAELFGPGFHSVLGVRVRRGGWRGARLLDTRYVCPSPSACFDVEDGHAIPLRGIARTIAGTRLLVEHGHTFSITEGRTGTSQPLAGVRGAWNLRSGGMLAIGTTVVDLAQGRVLGQVATEPVAIDATGRALVPDRREGEIDIGPLRWVRPRP